MTNVAIYVINLAHRDDRRAGMALQADRSGLDLPFFPAVDGRTATAADYTRGFAARGPLGALSAGAKACTQSHFNVFDAFLAGNAPVALVLEDDAELATDLGRWLDDLSWMPDDADLIKIEYYQIRKFVALLGPLKTRWLGRDIKPLWSRHTGTGGYIVTRKGAGKIKDYTGTIRVPIDHLMFNGNVSALARSLVTYQVVPALIRQQRTKAGSDVAALDAAGKVAGLAFAAREIKRGLYEIRRLPQQLWQMAFRGGRLNPVGWRDTTAEDS